MQGEVKTYSSRSNARRAAKQAGINVSDIRVYEVSEKNLEKFGLTEDKIGRYVWEAATVQEKITAPAPKKQNTLQTNRDQSTVDSPVRRVWEIADSMPGARRKDVIEACIAQGIARNTARTQYQRWYRAQRSNKPATDA